MRFGKETILNGAFLKGRVNDKTVEFNVQLEGKAPSSIVRLTREQFLIFADEIEMVRKEIINQNI